MLWRGLKGAMLGAAIITTVAATLVLLGFGIQIFLASNPIERSDAVVNLGRVLLLIVVVSVILGALGGLASRLPRHGMNILPSISIMAVFGILGWVLGLIICKGCKGRADLFIFVFLGMSLAGSVVVYLCGRDASSQEAPESKSTSEEES